MLKKIPVLFFVLAASLISSSSMAWSLFEISGERLDIDGKMVRIYGKDSEGDYIYHSKSNEMDGGIYVIAAAAPFALNPLPKTTEVIRAFLASKGFKIAEKPEGAARGIKFVVSGINLDWNNGQPAEGNSGNAAGQLATAEVVRSVAGSAMGIIAYGAGGSGHYNGTPLKLVGSSIANPTDEDMRVAFSDYAEHPDTVTAYSGNTGDDLNATTEDLLKVMTNYWLKKFFIEDKS